MLAEIDKFEPKPFDPDEHVKATLKDMFADTGATISVDRYTAIIEKDWPSTRKCDTPRRYVISKRFIYDECTREITPKKFRVQIGKSSVKHRFWDSIRAVKTELLEDKQVSKKQDEEKYINIVCWLIILILFALVIGVSSIRD
jgi:hypothetical protein